VNIFVLICLSTIDNHQERQNILGTFQRSNKDIIEITEEQMNEFAGNMLELCSSVKPEKRYLVMSTRAYESLTREQVAQIEKHCEIVHVPLAMVELCGGGSARCMLAEVFLPKME
jgi:hypothetical protein